MRRSNRYITVPEGNEGSIVFPLDQNRQRANTEDSAGDSSSAASAPRRCLCDVLKDSGDFTFDLSDRWRSAYLESMDQPIYPDDHGLVLERESRRRRLRKGVAKFVMRRSEGILDHYFHQQQTPTASMG